MTDRVKTALVGISGFGEWYIRVLLDDPTASKIHFIAAADPVPDRCRQLPRLKERNIPVYPSIDQLLDREKPQLLILCTPIHLHAEHTALALSHGVPVLCEKPLAGGVDDALEIVRAQRRSGNMVAIGYQWSFAGAIQALKTDLLAGTLGRPIRLKTLVSFPRPLKYFERNGWAGRIRTPDGRDVFDSPVNNATAHYLHNMLYLLGERWNGSVLPQSLQAELYRVNAIDNYDNAALRCRTAAGAEILFFTAHSIAEKLGPKCHFEFERATVTFDPLEPEAELLATFNDGRQKHYGNPDHSRPEKVRQSAEAAIGDGETACPAAAALPHTLCVAAAQQTPITPFPKDRCREAVTDENPMIVASTLRDAFERAFAANCLPAELGNVPWAVAGSEIQITSPEI